MVQRDLDSCRNIVVPACIIHIRYREAFDEAFIRLASLKRCLSYRLAIWRWLEVKRSRPDAQERLMAAK